MNTGFIYQIYDNTNGNKYYGSTIQRLSKRLTKHRGDYKAYLNEKYHFVSSFKIIENGDYTISLVETVEYDTKIELTARERFYIENNECVNKYIPCRSFQENKDKFKEWRETNKDKLKQKQKVYIEENKDKIKEYQEKNKDKIKEQKKEWRENNKDKIKEYRENNKDKLREKNRINYLKKKQLT
jgi:hypothetical protein